MHKPFLAVVIVTAVILALVCNVLFWRVSLAGPLGKSTVHLLEICSNKYSSVYLDNLVRYMCFTAYSY